MNDAALLDVNQTAEYLNTSERTVARQTAAGKIPGFRKLFGSTARWSKPIINQWIADGCPVDAAEWEKNSGQEMTGAAN